MESLLQEFCGKSGQRINVEKSKLHVSSIVDVNLALHFSQLSGIPLTNGFGTYLDILLFHNRVNCGLFEPLLVCVRGKLGGWSGLLLSRAGRCNLIRSVSSTVSEGTPVVSLEQTRGLQSFSYNLLGHHLFTAQSWGFGYLTSEAVKSGPA